MSIVGPLVNANGYETRFDRISTHGRVLRHPILTPVLLLLAAAAAAVATHIVPISF